MYIRTCTSADIVRTYDTEEDPRILKGPKLEIFGSRVFYKTQTCMVDDLGTRPKNSKFRWFWLENRHFVLFSAVADLVKKILTAVGDGVKKISESVLTRSLTRFLNVSEHQTAPTYFVILLLICLTHRCRCH
jgi:hypothetical protein